MYGILMMSTQGKARLKMGIQVEIKAHLMMAQSVVTLNL